MDSLKKIEILTEILNNNPSGIAAFQSVYEEGKIIDFKLVYANQTCTQLLDFSYDQLNGTHLSKLYPSGEANACIERYKQVLKTKLPLQEEVFFTHEKYQRWFHVTITPFRHDGVISYFQDITFKKQVETDRKKKYEMIESLFNGAVSSVWVKSPLGVYLYVNQGMANLIGRPYTEILGKKDADLFEPVSAKLFEDFDQKVMKSQKPETTYQEYFAGGQKRMCITHKYPLFSEDGELLGLAGMATEINDPQLENQAKMR